MRESASAAAEGQGVDVSTTELTEKDALLLLAMATLRQLERVSEDDCSAAARSARRSLKPFVSAAAESGSRRGSRGGSPKRPREEQEGAEQGNASSMDLGQYASAGVFDGNESKRAKFARLMGGAKTGSRPESRGSEHNTLAASTAQIKRINEDLETQFDSAMQHKGKKGLGAQ